MFETVMLPSFKALQVGPETSKSTEIVWPSDKLNDKELEKELKHPLASSTLTNNFRIQRLK